MATTPKTGAGTSISFSKTPQAKDDIFNAAFTGLTEDSGSTSLNVMFNDLGGNAKTLYSLDDAVNAVPSPIYSPTDLLAPDGFNVINYSQYGAAISITAGGQVAYDLRTTAFGSAFQSLALGETGYDTFTYAIRLGNGTLSWATATVEIAGANDAPVVAAADVTGELTEMLIPLGSLTDSGTIAFTDVDLTDRHSVSAVTPAGTTLGSLTARVSTDTTGTGLGGVLTWDYSVPAAAVEYLVLGQAKVESFSFNVLDGNGGSVSRTVDITINGTNDAPSLSVTKSAGTKVNEILLTITSEPAGTDRAVLSFANLPAGATVLDSHSVVVPAGGINFRGTETFTVVLDKDHDVHQGLSVTATGKNDGSDDEVGGHAVQIIDLAYDLESPQADLTFASNNQNMWGDFPGYIGWHEYIPFLGGAPIVWNAQTEEWDDAGAPDYWRSGEFQVIDVQLDSAQIIAAVSTAATTALAAAKAAFDVAAVAVDAAAKWTFDTAKAVFQTAENLYYFGARTVAAVVQNTFQLAQEAYVLAGGLYDAASYLFHTVATDLHNAAESAWNEYADWWLRTAISDLVAVPLRDAAELAYHGGTVLGVYIPGAVQIWDAAKYAFEWTATNLYNAALQTYNAAAAAVHTTAQTVFNDAKAVLATAEGIYNEVKEDIYDAAQTVYDGARNGVLAVLDIINDKVDFDSTLKVDAEVFAQVGLQVDFELDMGSVDTDIDYQLTSTTQYNQTTDMLVITPTMTNMTTGDAVAFDTISPNAKFYAALLYDVGANFDVFVDGKLVVNGTTIYDLSPSSDGLNLQFPISTESFASALGVIAGGNIDVGKMVLLDLDTTKLEPLEVPFIEALTQNSLTIEVAIPTLETEGTAATYVPATADIWTKGTFEEQWGPFPYASIDFSEISSAFFNIIKARFDFSEEFMDAYGLDSLNGKTLAETVEDIGTGLMANIWDVLSGQSEGVPIFILDMTDETSSSLLHLNLFPDSVMNSTTSADTGSLGFYAAYGESDPVVKVTLDVDAAYVAIIKAIAKAVASAVTVGAGTTIHPIIDLIPNPYNLEFGIEQVLKIAAVPKAVADEVTKWVDLGFSFEVADLDVSQEVNFSQDFTLSIDDMSYLVTMEDGTSTFTFTANGTGALSIPNASTYDANGDGLLTYTLDIVPTAMFSNDTEVGLSLGYQLDFLKGGFAAGLKLPLGDLLGIENADWLNLDFSAIDISMGPLLRVQGEIDTLDVDVFESRFNLDVGSDSYAGAVDVTPWGALDGDIILIGFPPTES